MASENTQNGMAVLQWVIDTRELWSSASKTADLEHVAAAPLGLLSTKERTDTLRFLRVKDAKLALVSRLVKRYAISRFCDVPWSEATAFKDTNTKPIFRKADGSEPLLFNVTHQDGLVILIGVVNPPPGLAIGVDIVSPSERRDHDHKIISKDGWSEYVDIHADVFSPKEVTCLKDLSFDRKSAEGMDHLLRWFYALWCLREAYIKMTGEALLASWLRDLEIRGFAPPEDLRDGVEGAWMYGKRVEGVDIKLEDLLGRFMVSSVVRRGTRGETVDVKNWQDFDIDEILSFAAAKQ